MSEITTTPTATAPAPSTFAVLALARAGFRRVTALVRALKHRRAVRELAELDDRTLRDMGLTRVEVKGALARPLAVDPSAVLLVRRVEERARARALAVVRLAAESRGEGADQQVCRCG